jgi:hypothetical protein
MGMISLPSSRDNVSMAFLNGTLDIHGEVG